MAILLFSMLDFDRLRNLYWIAGDSEPRVSCGIASGEMNIAKRSQLIVAIAPDHERYLSNRAPFLSPSPWYIHFRLIYQIVRHYLGGADGGE